MKKFKGMISYLLVVMFCLTFMNGCKNDSNHATAYGDLDENGMVDIKDAQMLLQASLEIILLEEASSKIADVDGDSRISMKDALYVLQYALGIIDAFPVETAFPEENTNT